MGSRSGLHAGHLSAQPAGHGTAFTPEHPFAPGERVSVTVTLRSTKAAGASGARGQRQLSFSFTVARPAGSLSGDNPGAARNAAMPANVHAASPSPPLTHTFVTEPGFTPPIVTMSGKDTDPSAGDIFLDAQTSGQNAAYILYGSLIWYQPVPSQPSHLSIRNVRVQSYHGHPVLTYWQGVLWKTPGGGAWAGPHP